MEVGGCDVVNIEEDSVGDERPADVGDSVPPRSRTSAAAATPPSMTATVSNTRAIAALSRLDHSVVTRSQAVAEGPRENAVS